MCDFSRFGGANEEWIEIEATLPPAAAQVSIEQLKADTNRGREAVAAQEFQAVAAKVTTADFRIPTKDGSSLEARTYRSHTAASASLLPIYVHFHGGGFLFGTLDSEDAICGRIAARVNVVVVNVNYRHIPDFPYPTAWEDAKDAVKWISGNADVIGGDRDRIFIGGISAGGNLCASFTLQENLKIEKDSKLVKGQLLLIPNLVHADCYEVQLAKMTDKSVSSLEENKAAPILPWERMRFFTDLLKVERPDLLDTRLNPGNATSEEVEGMPPTYIVVAGMDPLRDEALLFGKLLAENGVSTKVSLLKGVPHGFRRFGDRLSASSRWDQLLEEGVEWLIGSVHQPTEFHIREY